MPKRPLIHYRQPNPHDATHGVPYCAKQYGKPLGYMGVIARFGEMSRCAFYVTCPRCLRLLKKAPHDASQNGATPVEG